MHYYQRHLGDYAKDTKHLTMLEHGAYTLLLDWSYGSEEPLPEDIRKVYRIAGAANAAERRAVDAVVKEFFPTAAGRRNRRVELEIKEYQGLRLLNKTKAHKRWHTAGKAEDVPVVCPGNADGIAAEAAKPLPPSCPPPCRDDTNQTPNPKHQTPNPVIEGGGTQVSDLEILKWAELWPGEPATGAPKMDLKWVTAMLEKLNGRERWPDRWQRWLIACWRNAHFAYTNGGSGAGERKSAPVSASVSVIELSAEEDRLAYEINALRASNIEVSPEKLARWKAVQAELKRVRKEQ